MSSLEVPEYGHFVQEVNVEKEYREVNLCFRCAIININRGPIKIKLHENSYCRIQCGECDEFL